ncbi:hypothetical protein BOTNAR_0096g00270 [Botryotinia narcissicola]|uniref:Uncharacterized protein n=1 Tax=Botryotinia narcissicola TaxID=278944 RepID=A0A4Z1IQM5_9HELO|nr:hypothetical protein BOTNAR_0096g00270 [Botryotinia narcissicola]
MFATYDISWYDEVDKPEPRRKIYPFSPEYTRGAFKIEYEKCKDFYKSSGASLNAIKWLAQYVFWYKHEKTHRVPWSGGIPPCKGEEPYAEGFGPAICMWTPDDWDFDPSLTDIEVEDLDLRRFDRHDIEILEQLAEGLDEYGEIIRVGIWSNNETQKRLGQKYSWFEIYAHVDKIASEESGWEDFEVCFICLEGLDFRCKTPMGFHLVRYDDELPEFCLEDWIFIRDCSPVDPGLSTAHNLGHVQLSKQDLQSLSSAVQVPSDIESHRYHDFPSSPSPTETITGRSNDRNEIPLEYEGLRADPADKIDTGALHTRENLPAHLQSISESSQSESIPYTRPQARSTWNTGLGTVYLAPTPDTQLLGFETTKLQISSHTQQTLKSNRYHELCNLEQQSQARILIFDPYRAQDGGVSDTALVFIQGSPYARHQAVELLTAFQASLEAGSMEPNANFTFLGPGRSRGRKGNGLKKMS